MPNNIYKILKILSLSVKNSRAGNLYKDMRYIGCSVFIQLNENLMLYKRFKVDST